MKPIIGVVVRSETMNDKGVYYINNVLVRSLVECGGIPILIVPPHNVDYEEKTPSELERLTEENKKDIDKVLNMCDGIVMPGGHKWYEFDEYICKYVVDNNIPVLGICMGMQLLAKKLNNEKEGLDNTVLNETDINHNMPGIKYAHSIKILKDTLLYDIIGKEEINVNSRHNYHIPNELDFLKSAYSSDGIIEAVEYKENIFTLGIQWHPETMISYDMDAKRIIQTFIDKSKK